MPSNYAHIVNHIEIMEFESGSTRLHSLEDLLWTCRQTDYAYVHIQYILVSVLLAMKCHHSNPKHVA